MQSTIKLIEKGCHNLKQHGQCKEFPSCRKFYRQVNNQIQSSSTIGHFGNGNQTTSKTWYTKKKANIAPFHFITTEPNEHEIEKLLI